MKGEKLTQVERDKERKKEDMEILVVSQAAATQNVIV